MCNEEQPDVILILGSLFAASLLVSPRLRALAGKFARRSAVLHLRKGMATVE